MSFVETQSTIVLKIANAKAEIALLGASVYSWTINGEEHLFMSSASSISGPASLRGGIPICFPVFGPAPKREPFLKLKQHGFARNTRWEFKGVEQGEDSIEARFTLSSSHPDVKAIYAPAFECVYTVKLCPGTLSTALKVINPSEANLDFQALLHTYILLPSGSSPQDVRLKPLKGLTFTDKAAGGTTGTDERDELDFSAGEVDRVYNGVPDQIEVNLGTGKTVIIKTKALPNLTVWNPDQAKSAAMADMEKDGWKRFVCVEPGQTSFVSLKPHESWEGSQELSVISKKA